MRLDEAQCSGCGRPRPDHGWLAPHQPERPPAGKKVVVAVAFVALLSAMGIVPILGTRFFGTTSSSWAPQVGKGALLSPHAPMCPTRDLLRGLEPRTGAARRTGPATETTPGRGGGLPPGCIARPTAVAVKVLDLPHGTMRAANIQLASGARYWAFTTDLAAP